MLRRFWRVSVICLAAATAAIARAQEIGYVEDFALATNRAEALKTLIPGTDDFYYYHSLHYQQTEQFQQVDEILKPWIQKHGHNGRVEEILNRQALLLYPKDPERALKRIREKLGLRFDQQRELQGQKPNLPTTLDEKLITLDAFASRAFSSHVNLEGFEDAALEWLIDKPLNRDQRRHLLHRLRRPDYPRLVEHLLAELKEEGTPGLQGFPISSHLLPDQLQELLKQRPELINSTHWVNASLTKLQPAAHVEWQHDAVARRAHLDRLQAFADKLNPAFNSLKANIAYHRLAFDQSQGVYDEARFMAYVQLPRQTSYVNSEYLQRAVAEGRAANLNADFGGQTLLVPVGNDEPLVRNYLLHFLQKAADTKSYEPFLNDQYLRRVFAESKIVNGLGQPDQWSSLLSPAEFKALQDRIDLDFAPTNKAVIGVDDVVSVDIAVKNVKTLIVKVFELNTKNFYRSQLREVDTDLNLDGLVANFEKTETYNEPPLRRVVRHFDFPQLTKPGVYVIDFIGNGKSSRVLVKKGQLRHLSRMSTAGHVITVLDQANRHVKDASVFLAGHQYVADAEGYITVPFSTAPGRQPIVLSHGELASLDYLQHQAEQYSFNAAFHVDREALLKLKKATVAIRPQLSVNGTPVSLKVLEDVRLTIASVDQSGVAAAKEVRDFKLFEDREATFEFQVPVRLDSLTFHISARVKQISTQTPVLLEAKRTVQLNEVDKTDRTEDLYLVLNQGRYAVDVLGRTGEALPDRAVRVTLKHRDVKSPSTFSLKSDLEGRLQLGTLAGIDTINVVSPQGVSHTWRLPTDRHSVAGTLHARVGEGVQIPYMGGAQQMTPSEVSLLETRGNTFVANWFKAISLGNGLLTIKGLPAGEYSLRIKSTGTELKLRVADGEQRDDFIHSPTQLLEVRDADLLQLASVQADDKQLKISLRNASAVARVHVIATKYVPRELAIDELQKIRDQQPLLKTLPVHDSKYISGRDIGDEYRYVIDRRYASKFSGNTATKPSLLLNPWAVRTTSTSQQEAAAGTLFDSAGAAGDAKEERVNAAFGKAGAAGADSLRFTNHDFLGEQSVTLLNLPVGNDGVITVDLAALGSHSFVQVIAVDPQQTVSRVISLPERDMQFNDLRLTKTLPLDQHFTEQKQVSVLAADKSLVIDDVTSSKFTSYDSLAKVYGLYSGMSSNPQLVEFNFILRWPTLKPEEKRDLYSKHACHELSFFLAKKDPEFFATVIQPYLRNKQAKTFLDHWLLGDDLTSYRQPWAYERLNAVERILLAQRLEADRLFTRQLINEQVAILPPNLERIEQLFGSAVRADALDTDDDFGARGLVDKLAETDRMNRADEKKSVLLGRSAGRVPFVGRDSADAPRGGAAAAEPSSPPAPVAAAKSMDFAKRKANLSDLSAERAGAAPQRRAEMADGQAKPEAQNALRFRQKSEKESDKDTALGLKADAYWADDAARRDLSRALYQKLDKTQEWAENNYYKLPLTQQVAGLITATAFWKDYAAHNGDGPFFSKHLPEASRNFTEMMFALAVLDLPFESKEHKSSFDGAKMTLAAGSPMILFHQEIKPAAFDPNAPRTVLVNENFFRHGDRHRVVNGEQVDKYVTDEFLTHTVYGGQVVVTNPTSARQKLSVLLQVPAGAVAVAGAHQTRSVPLDLQPYQTQTLEYHFYFPAVGEFGHYPVHIAKNEKIIAFAAARQLKVVETPTTVDKESWDYVSQHGEPVDVVQFLKTQNLLQVNLDRIAWRMRDPAFFKQVIDLLDQRHIYQESLWAFSVSHNDPARMREFLKHSDGLLNQCGPALESPLVTIDPVERRSYEHFDYSPLVNARAHQLGKRRQILNDRLYQQYHQLLHILSCRRALDENDKLAVTYYLVLQDRIDEAEKFFSQVNPQKVDSKLQYDYFAAYFDLFNEKPDLAKTLVAKYRQFPVNRWQAAFSAIAQQLEEAGQLKLANGPDLRTAVASIGTSKAGLPNATEQGSARSVSDAGVAGDVLAAVTETTSAPVDASVPTTEKNTPAAATEPNLEFAVEAKQVKVKFQNIKSVRVNYYAMDIELLFSRNPFVQQFSNEFSFIRPNESVELKLPENSNSFEFPLPAKFHSSNVLVEISAAGLTKTQTYYSHALNVQVVENYGQVKVTHDKTSKPLSKVYVKVFALMGDGSVKFYKDGYTDLRGRFDYTALNTNELDFVQKFSLLILSEEHGATIREAAAPKR